MAKLGELLRDRGALTQEQLDQALTIQEKTGSRLGDIVIGEGTANLRVLYEVIAEKNDLPFVDLISDPPDATLLEEAAAETYLRLKAIPWRREGTTLLIATAELSGAVVDWAKSRYGDDTRLVMTSPLDIRRTVAGQYGPWLDWQSRLALWARDPKSSARVTLWPGQRAALWVLALAVFAAAFYQPVVTALVFIALCHAVYTATMLFKCAVFFAGRSVAVNRSGDSPEIDDALLPVYTVLVPMYREPESLPGMLAALDGLDYPPSKLDIKLVIEADDRETLRTALALKPGYRFDIIRVPPSEPRTKPKACNYALRFAEGEYVTVFDADDRPDPLQLKKAVRMFRTSPPNVACVQARLNYYNAEDTLLTRLFSLEYTMLFYVMLQGLERMGIPIPLGGTSNHLALSRLRELGEWDPYNVTEDADLGVRLAARGFTTRMLDSYTLEEAPVRVWPWMKQRSRWIKGYMQTWLVHMRDPRHLWNDMGARGFLGFQCFVGLSCFTFLTAPLVWALSVPWMMSSGGWGQVAFPGWLAWITGVNLVLYALMHWYFSFYCLSHTRRRSWGMAAAAVGYPLYLGLHALASYKALWQLIIRPHFWEKTAHGLVLARKTAKSG